MSCVGGIVLAAGSSIRFGEDKLTHSLDGKAIVAHIVEAALGAGLVEVVVVTRSVDDPVTAAIGERPRLRLVPNPDHLQGMSTSLRCGLRALHPSVDAAVVLLGDEPEITAELIATVADAYIASGARAMRTQYQDRVGHPVVLARELWPSLLSEEGDTGARRVLEEAEGVEAVEVGKRAPIDVDTRDDLAALRRRLSRT